jgi:AcrR family transcriptional regulator
MSPTAAWLTSIATWPGPGAGSGRSVTTSTDGAPKLGGVRFVTLAPVTERAGLHRTGVRRYYASKEELLLELAERGWRQWRDAIAAETEGRTGLGAREIAAVLSETIAALPGFCDLLSHVAMSLEGDVDIERARQYKVNSFAAHDEIVRLLDNASVMTAGQVRALVPAALAFAPRLRLLLESTAIGIIETVRVTQELLPAGWL